MVQRVAGPDDASVLIKGDNTALAGAIDMHVHGYPDIGLSWPMRTDDHTLVALAAACGMRGIVLKSHFWPTMDRAMHLQDRLPDTNFRIYSSLTLNPLIGGIQPTTVEAAALHGAKMVFMPTWGSVNDNARGGFARRALIDPLLPSFTPYISDSAISAVDANGRIRSEVVDVLHIAMEHNMAVSTGHLAAEESLVLAETAADVGFSRLLFAHPLGTSIGAEAALVRDVAATGAYVEMTAAHSLLPRDPISVASMYEVIESVGVQRVVLSSDVYFDWLPPHVEVLRMIAGQLRSLGMQAADIRQILVTNPGTLLSD